MTSRLFALALALGLCSAGAGSAAPALTSASGGRVRAVVIGIDGYESEPKLRGAEADAADLADALRQGGATLMSGDGEPFFRAPSRSTVVAAMTRLVAESAAGDLAVITYSGHGARVPEYDLPGWHGLEPGGMNEEFVLSGYAPAGPGLGEVIVNKKMKAWLSRLDAEGVDVLFVADTCFGGGAVRGLDPRSDDRTRRGVAKALPHPAAGQFTPIPITARELRTGIADLPRVTFLGGADALHEVPEVRIPGVAGTRGALSYAVAQALRGRVAGTDVGAGAGTVTRESLFDAALQIVSQYTDDLQLIEPQPQSRAPEIAARPVFRLAAGGGPPPPVVAAADPPLRVAALNGDPAPLLAQISARGGGAPPFALVDPAGADLVWDLVSGDVLSHGDVLRHGAVPEDLPGLLARTAAVAAIKGLSEPRPLRTLLGGGGRVYAAGDRPGLEVPDAGGRDLVVFDVGSDGTVQVLSPDRHEPAFVAEPAWSYAPQVTPPFGADQVVSLQGRRGSLDALAARLWAFDGSAVADRLPGLLRDAVAADPSARLGTVSLFTAP